MYVLLMTHTTLPARPVLFLPDTETAVDLIYFEPIATALIDLISAAGDKPVSIGVHGDWGAGKSSVLRMVEAGLAGREDVLVLHFDGWRFQGFDDAKTALLEAIVAALRDSRRFDAKLTDELGSFVKRVRWLKVLKKVGEVGVTVATGLPVGLLGHSATDAGETGHAEGEPTEGPQKPKAGAPAKAKDGDKDAWLKDEASAAYTVHSLAKEFEKLLAKTRLSKLVVLIDDLDRCLPETTIATLEAIRLFLFVRKTAFVIAADESMIEYAVRQHFPDLPAATNSTSYSRNYLEKLIQVPLRLPSLGVEEAKIYVTLLLVQALLGEDHAQLKSLIALAREIIRQPWLSRDLAIEQVRDLDPDRRDELMAAYQLAQQIGRPIAEGTSGNPRQIKRFINALAVREAIARARGLEGHVKRPELAKLMLAERFRPDFYASIARAALTSKTGTVPDIVGLEEPADTESSPGQAPETKSASPDGEATWIVDDWLRAWGSITPKLGTVDLRPYVFVARDRRVLIGNAVVSEGVALVLAALAGGPMALAGVDQNLRSLSAPDAEALFTELCNRVLQASDLKSKPVEFDALCRLVEHQTQLRLKFVEFLADQKPASVGPWIASGWRPAQWNDPARARAKELVRGWTTGSNKQLKPPASALLKTLEPH